MGTKRIEYIDAMRGFTMLLVVFSHVIVCTFKPSGEYFSFNDIFMTFRMPLFFFLSGFLMYKASRFVELGKTCDFLKKKFMVQLIPTVVFSLLFAIIFNQSYGDLWLDKSKSGFWFTYTLFFFFLIYSIGDFIIGKVCKGKLKLILGIGAALLVYAISKYSLSPSCPWYASKFNGILGLANFQYFIFFFFGAICKRYFEEFTALMDKKYGMAIIVSLFVIIQLLLQVNSLKGWIISSFGYSIYSVIKSISGFFGIVVIFAFFRRYQGSFTKDKPLGRALQYVGERTLDVYLIHLFLVYGNLDVVGKFFVDYSNPVLELFAGLLISVLIVAVTLVISNAIRCSDFLAKHLLGKVIEPKD